MIGLDNTKTIASIMTLMDPEPQLISLGVFRWIHMTRSRCHRALGTKINRYDRETVIGAITALDAVQETMLQVASQVESADDAVWKSREAIADAQSRDPKPADSDSDGVLLWHSRQWGFVSTNNELAQWGKPIIMLEMIRAAFDGTYDFAVEQMEKLK